MTAPTQVPTVDQGMQPLHIGAALLIILIWGFNVVAIKLTVAEFPPLMGCAVRFAIVVAVLLPWLRIEPGQMGRLFGLSFTFGVLNFGLLFVSMQYIDGTLVAIIVQTSVPMSLVLARVFLGERFGWVRSAAVGLSFAGVVVLFGEPTARSNPIAVVTLLASLLAWSVGNIQLKALRNVSPMNMQAWVGLFSIPMILGLSWATEDDQLTSGLSASALGWAAVAFGALAASAVGHSLWYWLLTRYEGGQVVPFLLLQPIVATIAAISILGERLGAYGWLGGALVIIGVTIVQLRGRPRVPAPARIDDRLTNAKRRS